MHYCSYVHDDLLPQDLREKLEDVLFQLFTRPGEPLSSAPRGADAPADAGTKETAVERRERALRYLVTGIVAGAEFTSLTAGNAPLAERVSHDALHWCANQWAQTGVPDAPSRESQLIERLGTEGAGADADTAREVLELTAGYAEMAPVRKIFGELAGELGSSAGMGGEERQAAVEMLREQWSEIVEDRADRQQRSRLHSALVPYVAELNRNVPRMHRYFQTVKDLFGDSLRFWDLTRGRWQDVDVGPLVQYSELLAREPSIRELARILGRGRGRDARRPQVEEQVMLHLAPYRGTAGRSEVTGIRFGSDVGSLLPSELALLSSPDTEPLFYRKFSESELLCLAYTTEATYFRAEYRTHRLRKTHPDDRGPLILCVDTSGSMAGLPERVAKAICLAVVRIAAMEKRHAFVISFSDRVETLEISDPSSSLAALSEFLGRSFYGGTDLRPAIDAAIRATGSPEFRNADVLVISDFRVPKILDRSIRGIKERQRTHGTGFYSLTVNRYPVIDTFNIFDRSWLYDISNPDSPGIPVRSLTSL